MKSSREQFEEWFSDEINEGMKVSASGGYENLITQSAWMAWQDSRAAIEIELPSKEDPANLFCEVYSCDMVHESLANCGLKVKS